MYVDKAGFPLATNQHLYPRSLQHRPQFDRQPVAGKTKLKSKKSEAFSACGIVPGCITDENYSQPVAEEKDDTLLNTMPVSSPVFSAPVNDGNNSFENASLTKPKAKSILRDITNRIRIHGGEPIADKHQKCDTFEPEISFVEETIDLDAIKSLVSHDFDREEDIEVKHARKRLLFTQGIKSPTPVINKSESIPVTSTKDAVDNTSALGKTFNYFYVEGKEAYTTISVPFDDTKKAEGGSENNKFEIESCLKEAVEIFEDLRIEMASAFSVSEWQKILSCKDAERDQLNLPCAKKQNILI